LLTEFLDDLLNNTPNLLNPEKDMNLNLNKIQETPFEQLDKLDQTSLLLVLLKQLQPYYSQQNLLVTPPFSNLHSKSPLVNKGGDLFLPTKGATPNTTRATKK
jgi:hypothetical protein